MDPAVLREELSTQGYGYTKTALTMLVHFVPMLLKLGQVFEGPTNSWGCGIVAGFGRSGGAAKAYSHYALDQVRTWVKKIMRCDNSVDTSTPVPAGPPVALAPPSEPAPVGPNERLKAETFVDDTTMILWANHKLNGLSDLSHLGYEVSKNGVLPISPALPGRTLFFTIPW